MKSRTPIARLGRQRAGDTPAYTDAQARRIIAKGKGRMAKRRRRQQSKR